MLHGLSHALMAEIALECGYPASALKERIYALWDPARFGATGRFGILIYTATAGNQGTLGGLVATASISRASFTRLCGGSNCARTTRSAPITSPPPPPMTAPSTAPPVMVVC